MNTFENKHIIICLKNNICYGTYKENAKIDLAAALSIVQGRIKLLNNKSYPAIVDISNIISIDKNAREFLKTDGYKLMSKVAIIANSVIGEAIANYFIQIDTPPVETLIFDTIEDAENHFLQIIQ